MEAYRPEHLDGAALVFAAGPPDLNQHVVGDARARGIWVNAASEPKQGDFFLPASVRRGSLVLAVSTGGAAPFLARMVRAQLDTQYDEAYEDWVSLLAEMRPFVRERIADLDQRRALLTSLCQSHWLDRIRHDKLDTVRAAMREAIDRDL
jgi:precorrin-2 dehydrogenase / sirohydrochlorin ferrochelatase